MLGFFFFQFMDDTVLSSVICDDRCDSIIVTLDKKGFHPDVVYLQKVTFLSPHPFVKHTWKSNSTLKKQDEEDN